MAFFLHLLFMLGCFSLGITISRLSRKWELTSFQKLLFFISGLLLVMSIAMYLETKGLLIP